MDNEQDYKIAIDILKCHLGMTNERAEIELQQQNDKHKIVRPKRAKEDTNFN